MDRRIRRSIRAKLKLIKLLDEQKQATIHRAVTRGLDQSVRLKTSSVEWKDELPEHWSTLRVKQCSCTISKGTTPSTEGRDIQDSGSVRFLKAENIAAGRVTDKPLNYIDDETNLLLRRSQLAEGDILFVIAGATLGKIAVIEKQHLPANTNQAVAFIRPNRRVIPKYLATWLQSPRIRDLTWLHAVQSAQPNISMADLGNFPIPLPPVDEQCAIVEEVEQITVDIESARATAEREITLLREYRTRLVADVVTGKLDVRQAAGQLPAEIEQPEELPLAGEDWKTVTKAELTSE